MQCTIEQFVDNPGYMHIVTCNSIVMILGDNSTYSVNYLNYSEMKIPHVNSVMTHFNIHRMCTVLLLY